MAEKQKLGVLCSGRGTDLQSIIDAIGRKEVDAEIAIVLADKSEAFALERAKKAGIKAVCVNRKAYEGREPFEEALIKELEEAGVTLVVLAGFMRILTPLFVKHFAGRIMNIHPALLPSFPGAHAHRDVLAYGVKVSGCTVHFVDEGTDSGPIIMQAAVPVLPGFSGRQPFLPLPGGRNGGAFVLFHRRNRGHRSCRAGRPARHRHRRAVLL